MSRLPALSEADVRLRLYPSTGRVVKVTEGYWPTASPDPVPDVMLSTVAVERRQLSEEEWHSRLMAIGGPCNCTACLPASEPLTIDVTVTTDGDPEAMARVIEDAIRRGIAWP